MLMLAVQLVFKVQRQFDNSALYLVRFFCNAACNLAQNRRCLKLFNGHYFIVFIIHENIYHENQIIRILFAVTLSSGVNGENWTCDIILEKISILLKEQKLKRFQIKLANGAKHFGEISVLTIFLATYIIMIFSRSLTNVTFCMYDVVSCYVKIKLLKSHLFYMSAGLLTHVLF
ncbi:hypothetical protein T11_17535 [Trichinella zimbabwensis]|uniref:Uncharacterized protein n=1 Tax=Trichinella zimbabwensis TaxID=268475 RepID=A0A0V1H506_9BILA|nr:hypothetical protein T11_17535 [Trichinella zimbabwensis]